MRHAALTLGGVVALAVGWGAAWWAMGSGDGPDAVQARLHRDRPEVLVLGNSVARLALDEDGVAEITGAERVAIVAPDEATSADWTALLRHHVPTGDAGPHTVWVVTRPGLAFDARPRSGASAARLDAWLGPGDADLWRLAAGGWVGGWWMHRDARAASARGWLARTARRTALAGRGADEGAVAWDVYGALAAAPAQTGRLGVPGPGEGGGVDPSRSAMPALLDEIEARGVSLTVVVPPVQHEAPGEDVPQDVVARGWAEVARTPGVTVHDLSTLSLPDEAYVDAQHLSAWGRWRVQDALRALGRGEPLPGPAWSVLDGEGTQVERWTSDGTIVPIDPTPGRAIEVGNGLRVASAEGPVVRVDVRLTAHGEDLSVRVGGDGGQLHAARTMTWGRTLSIEMPTPWSTWQLEIEPGEGATGLRVEAVAAVGPP